MTKPHPAQPPGGVMYQFTEAELAERDRQVAEQAAAQALRDAADTLDSYDAKNLPPDDPRWTCDLGYYGEATWLRARADSVAPARPTTDDDVYPWTAVGWDDRKTLSDIWQEHSPLPEAGLSDATYSALIAVAQEGARAVLAMLDHPHAAALASRPTTPTPTTVAVAGRRSGKTAEMVQRVADECERRGLPVEITPTPTVSESVVDDIWWHACGDNWAAYLGMWWMEGAP